MKFVFTLLAGAAVVYGASKPAVQLQGEYVEARNADVWTGPCFANSEVGNVGELAVFGWRVDRGSFDGVQLDGLSVVAVVRASHTLGDQFNTSYPVKSVLILDEKASAAQRTALTRFAKQMSGDLLQDVVRTEIQPISFTIEGSVHEAKATVVAGNLARLQTRAIQDIDAICHSNEGIWYQPLTKLEHAMPAYALAHKFAGEGLGATWSSPEKRSAFVGTFEL
jgi:hypothetical protein